MTMGTRVWPLSGSLVDPRWLGFPNISAGAVSLLRFLGLGPVLLQQICIAEGCWVP